jgi:hypothetical protein
MASQPGEETRLSGVGRGVGRVVASGGISFELRLHGLPGLAVDDGCVLARIMLTLL